MKCALVRSGQGALPVEPSVYIRCRDLFRARALVPINRFKRWSPHVKARPSSTRIPLSSWDREENGNTDRGAQINQGFGARDPSILDSGAEKGCDALVERSSLKTIHN